MARRSAPMVTVEQGTLEGRWKAGGKVAVFRGVPFAAPPVGDLRWQPPQPAASWTGVRSAAKDGPMAIQREVDLESFLTNLIDGHAWNPARTKAVKALLKHAPRPKQDEDCLHLTVRTPRLEPDAKLPVMVWIHGGDHQDGSSIDVYYAANVLAQHGVVTVAINYRLGLMGYFAHPDLVAESPDGVAGNYGTMDQIAALEWVQANIENFGGDPNNVTIFGESAGGESVLHMMTSPLARGLFHQAIPQSAGNGGQMIRLHEPFLAWDSAVATGERFAADIGVTGDDQLARLRAMPADELNQLGIMHGPGGGFYPVIDGHVLPTSPLAAFAAGTQADVPMIIGSNTDEGSALVGSIFNGAMVEYRHLPTSSNAMSDEMKAAFVDDLEELEKLYPGIGHRDRDTEKDFCGDHLFGARAFWYARHHQRIGAPTWLYMFARTPIGNDQTLGAYHAAELPFVHGSNVPIFPMTKDDKALALRMRHLWTSLARMGRPDAGSVEWPAFTEDEPKWMRFDHTIVAEPVTRIDKYRILNARDARLVAEMQSIG